MSRPAKLEDLFFVNNPSVEKTEATTSGAGEMVAKPPPLLSSKKTEAPEPHAKASFALACGYKKALATADASHNAASTTTTTIKPLATTVNVGNMRTTVMTTTSPRKALLKPWSKTTTVIIPGTSLFQKPSIAVDKRTAEAETKSSKHISSRVPSIPAPSLTQKSSTTQSSESAQESTAKSTALPTKKLTPKAKSPSTPSKQWARKSTLSSLLHLASPKKGKHALSKAPETAPKSSNDAKATLSASRKNVALAKKRSESKDPSSSTLLPVKISSTADGGTTLMVIVSKETEAIVQIPRSVWFPGDKNSTSEPILIAAVAHKKVVDLSLTALPQNQLPATTNGTKTDKVVQLDETPRAPKKLLLRRIEKDAKTNIGKDQKKELAFTGGISVQNEGSSAKVQQDKVGALVEIITGAELSENSLVELENDVLLSRITWASTCRASEEASFRAQRKTDYNEDILLCDLGLLGSVVEQVESSPVISYREIHAGPIFVSEERFQKEVVFYFFKNVVAEKDGKRAFCAHLKKLQQANCYELKVTGLTKLVKQFQPFFWEWWFSAVDRVEAEALPRRQKALALKSVANSKKPSESSLRNRGNDLNSYFGRLVLTASVDSSTTMKEDNCHCAPPAPPAKTTAKAAHVALRASLPESAAAPAGTTAEMSPKARVVASRDSLLVPTNIPRVPPEGGLEESTRADIVSNITPSDPPGNKAAISANDKAAKITTPPTTNDTETTMDDSSSTTASGSTMTPAVLYSETDTCSDRTEELNAVKPQSLPLSLPTGDSSKEKKRSLATSFHVDFDPKEPLRMFVSSHNQDTVCIVRSMEPSCIEHPELRLGTRIEAAAMLEDFSINKVVKVESHRDLKLVYVRAAHTPAIKKIRVWFTNDIMGQGYINETAGDGWNGTIKQFFKQEPLADFQQSAAQSSKELTAKKPQKARKRVSFTEYSDISNKRQRLDNAGKAFPTETLHVVGKTLPAGKPGDTGNAAPMMDTRISGKYLENTSTSEQLQHHLLSFLRAVSSDTNDWKSQRTVEALFMADLNLQNRDPLRAARERVTREGLVEWGRVFLAIDAVVKQERKMEGFSEKCYMRLSQKGVTVLSVGKIKSEVSAVGNIAIKSEFRRMAAAAVVATTSTVTTDIDPLWFVSGGSRKKCNKFFSAKNCCFKAKRCQYLHVQPRFGLPLVDHSQLRAATLDQYAVLFHREVGGAGVALWTCVYHDKQTNIFYKAEGGVFESFDGLRDVYWYQTKSQALLAVSRVFAASQLLSDEANTLLNRTLKREINQSGHYGPASDHRYSFYGPNRHL